jgi:glycerol-3-phosphate acyltransferase PlsX
MPSVIALDAMGSDKAPKPEIEGALQAARHHDVRVLLVGPEPRLRAELVRYPGARRLGVEVVHASEVITMEDKVDAIRGKRDSSIRVGLRLVREGRAAGFVTAGNTEPPWPPRRWCWAPCRAWTVRRWQRRFRRC